METPITKTYTIMAKCSHCGHRATLEVPYGTPLNSKYKRDTNLPCPICGVKGLYRLRTFRQAMRDLVDF
jgi:DNA-directed RNA polymerase subunit RPC12/RpoP